MLTNYSMNPNVALHENPSVGSHAIPRAQTGDRTDEHDKATSRFSQLLCEKQLKRMPKISGGLGARVGTAPISCKIQNPIL